MTTTQFKADVDRALKVTGYSTDGLARTLGVSRPMLWMLANGKRTIQPHHVTKLRKLTNANASTTAD